jgi:hypothetical protein
VVKCYQETLKLKMLFLHFFGVFAITLYTSILSRNNLTFFRGALRLSFLYSQKDLVQEFKNPLILGLKAYFKCSLLRLGLWNLKVIF